MIETIQDVNYFIDNCKGDWIVHVVPIEEDRHPINSHPSILFIHVIATCETFYFAFDHPDSHPIVTYSNFMMAYAESKKRNNKWALDSKTFEQLIPWKSTKDANMCGSMRENDILELRDFETSAHVLIRRNSNGSGEIGKIIPLLKHLEVFNNLCESIKKMIYRVPKLVQEGNSIISNTLSAVETNGIFVNREIFAKHFPTIPDANGFVYSQYNLYTSTGRPSNRFGGVNYAALNTTDGSRSAIVSRYHNSGKIVVMDYTAFHPHIICMLTKYELTDPNVYGYLARLYFKKTIVDDIDVAEAKQITFRQLYGGVESKYAHIKYLTNLKDYIEEQWELFQKNGYVETPIFKRRITDKHIIDPNPSKVFNYILQALEGEIAIPLLQKVMKYLRNKKTKAILYTYDAVIYDFHKDDGLETFHAIHKIMSMDGKFPMKSYMGESYQTVSQVNL